MRPSPANLLPGIIFEHTWLALADIYASRLETVLSRGLSEIGMHHPKKNKKRTTLAPEFVSIFPVLDLVNGVQISARQTR